MFPAFFHYLNQLKFLPMAEVIELADVAVQVQDVQEDIHFSNLSINQRLADTNSFSFIWRIEKEDATISDHVDFYKTHLGKEVTFTIDDGFVFKGIIQLINCYNQFSHNVEYEVTGKGLLMKLDEVPQCKSFTKKTIKDIFSDLKGDMPMKLNPASSDELFYTVQYNQTVFAFLSMLAARHGEWLYYTGEELVLGKPDSKAYELHLDAGNVYDLNISAKMQQQPRNIAGFDSYRGEYIETTKEAEKPGGTGMIAAAMDASKTYYGNGHDPAYFGHPVKKEMLERYSELNQQSGASSSVYISGRTYLSGLRLGGTIKIIDEKGNSAGEYIIVELQHTASGKTSYQNHFVAIPSETAVPPYTNPQLFPYSKPQPAVVKENEDKDGLARVKVRMSWQKEGETTPWLSVVVPHAGNGKGFRFLPEKDDEVIVDFIEHNAERPFVIGAVYSEKNKAGVPDSGNDLKFIGTRSGRRIIFDDKASMIQVLDNVFEKDEFNLDQVKMPNNRIVLANASGADPYISIASSKSDNDYSYMQLDAGKEISICLESGGQPIASLKFSKDGKKITISSKGVINLTADGDINLEGQNIKMTARKNMELTVGENITATFGKDLSFTAGGNATVIAGSNADIISGANFTATGAQNVSLTAGIKAEVTAGAVSQMQAPMVKIN